jgi:hypothetical protein
MQIARERRRASGRALKWPRVEMDGRARGLLRRQPAADRYDLEGVPGQACAKPRARTPEPPALRRGIAATRWPEKEIVSDWSQGVQLATIQKLAGY